MLLEKSPLLARGFFSIFFQIKIRTHEIVEINIY